MTGFKSDETTLEAIGGGDYREAFEAGGATVEAAIRDVDGVKIAVLPEGGGRWSWTTVDVEDSLPRPRYKRAEPVVRDLGSFIEYLKRHKNDGTVVFADEDGNLVGILNHHDAGEDQEYGAGWQNHRVTLRRPYTKPWVAWTKANGVAMPQVTFAEFLEDRLTEIAEPAGALLMQIATEFEAGRSLQFKSSKRLADGQVQLQYDEQLSGSTSSGAISVPTSFVLSLQPYRDVEPFAVSARLRWRLSGPSVTFAFLLDENALEEELERIREEAAEQVIAQAGVPVFRGTP